MQLRPLGPTGALVSDLCLGAMTFGAESEWELVPVCELEGVGVLPSPDHPYGMIAQLSRQRLDQLGVG